MYSKQTKLINASGLHARPASDFVLKAKSYASKITVRNVSDPDAEAVNAKSIVRILAQGLACGSTIEVAAEGEDEVVAVDELIALIETGFGE